MSKYAVLGLALSGHPKAAEALESIRELLTSGGRKSLLVAENTPRSEINELVSEALRTHKEIADLGLVQYYRRSRR